MRTETTLLTPAQVATRLGLRPDTIRDYIKRGDLPAVDVASGKRTLPLYRVAESDLLDFINQRRVGASTTKGTTSDE